MNGTTALARRSFGETTRSDIWWLQPLLVFVGLSTFIVYSTWAAFQGKNYFVGNYLSPFYSPELFGDSPHSCALLTAARELQQLSPDGEYISYWQTPWAEVHSDEAIPVNLDGEPVRFSSVRYETVPSAIHLIVQPNCPLLSATAT